MTDIDKTKMAALQGDAILKHLGPGLRKRGVPESSYVMVNLANGEFVTGKTKTETEQRFRSLHPGAEGWMQLVGDVIGVTPPDDDDEPALPADGDTTAPDVAKPRNTSVPRWNGRRGPARS